MSKKATAQKTPEGDLESLIQKIEGLLNTEIEKLPVTLQTITPDKRIDFVSKTLPVVIKYREEHPRDGGWTLPDWK